MQQQQEGPSKIPTLGSLFSDEDGFNLADLEEDEGGDKGQGNETNTADVSLFLGARNSEYPSAVEEEAEWLNYPSGSKPVLSPVPKDTLGSPTSIFLDCETQTDSFYASYASHCDDHDVLRSGSSSEELDAPIRSPQTQKPPGPTITIPAPPPPPTTTTTTTYSRGTENPVPANPTTTTSLPPRRMHKQRKKSKQLETATDAVVAVPMAVDSTLCTECETPGDLLHVCTKCSRAYHELCMDFSDLPMLDVDGADDVDGNEPQAWICGHCTASEAQDSEEEEEEEEEDDDDDASDDDDGMKGTAADDIPSICNECKAPGDLYFCVECPHAYHADCMESPDLPTNSQEAQFWMCPSCVTELKRQKCITSESDIDEDGANDDDYELDSEEEAEDVLMEEAEKETWRAEYKNLVEKVHKLLSVHLEDGSGTAEPSKETFRALACQLQHDDLEILNGLQEDWSKTEKDAKASQLLRQVLRHLSSEDDEADEDEGDTVSLDLTANRIQQDFKELKEMIKEAPVTSETAKKRQRAAKVFLPHLKQLRDRMPSSPEAKASKEAAKTARATQTQFDAIVDLTDALLQGSEFFPDDLERAYSLVETATQGRSPKDKKLVTDLLDAAPVVDQYGRLKGQNAETARKRKRKVKVQQLQRHDSVNLGEKKKKKKKEKNARENARADGKWTEVEVRNALPQVATRIPSKTWKTVLFPQADSKGYCSPETELVGNSGTRKTPGAYPVLASAGKNAILYQKPHKVLQIPANLPWGKLSQPSSTTISKALKAFCKNPDNLQKKEKKKKKKRKRTEAGAELTEDVEVQLRRRLLKHYIGWILHRESPDEPIWPLACLRATQADGEHSKPVLCLISSASLAELYPTTTSKGAIVPEIVEAIEKAKTKVIEGYDAKANRFRWTCDWECMKTSKDLTRAIDKSIRKTVDPNTKLVPLIDPRRVLSLLRKGICRHVNTEALISSSTETEEGESATDDGVAPKKRQKTVSEPPVSSLSSNKKPKSEQKPVKPDLRSSLGDQYVVPMFPPNGSVNGIPATEIDSMRGDFGAHWFPDTTPDVESTPDVSKLAYEPLQRPSTVESRVPSKSKNEISTTAPMASQPPPKKKRKTAPVPTLEEKKEDETPSKPEPEWVSKHRIDLLKSPEKPKQKRKHKKTKKKKKRKEKKTNAASKPKNKERKKAVKPMVNGDRDKGGNSHYAALMAVQRERTSGAVKDLPSWFHKQQGQLIVGKDAVLFGLNKFEDGLAPDPIIQAFIQALDLEQCKAVNGDLQEAVWITGVLEKADVAIMQNWCDKLKVLKGLAADTDPKDIGKALLELGAGKISIRFLFLMVAVVIRLLQPEGIGLRAGAFAPLEREYVRLVEAMEAQAQKAKKSKQLLTAPVEDASLLDDFSLDMLGTLGEGGDEGGGAEHTEGEAKEYEAVKAALARFRESYIERYSTVHNIHVMVAKEQSFKTNGFPVQALTAAFLLWADSQRKDKTWRDTLKLAERAYKDRFVTPIEEAAPSKRGEALKKILLDWNAKEPNSIEPQLLILLWESIRPLFVAAPKAQLPE